jgi:hypothetical protein
LQRARRVVDGRNRDLPSAIVEDVAKEASRSPSRGFRSALAAEIIAGTFAVSPVSTPLTRVQAAWSASTVPGERIVITPN